MIQEWKIKAWVVGVTSAICIFLLLKTIFSYEMFNAIGGMFTDMGNTQMQQSDELNREVAARQKQIVKGAEEVDLDMQDGIEKMAEESARDDRIQIKHADTYRGETEYQKYMKKQEEERDYLHYVERNKKAHAEDERLAKQDPKYAKLLEIKKKLFAEIWSEREAAWKCDVDNGYLKERDRVHYELFPYLYKGIGHECAALVKPPAREYTAEEKSIVNWPWA